MRNEQFVKGIGLIIEGLIEIQNYFKQEEAAVEKVEETSQEDTKEEVNETNNEILSEDELRKMKFTEFKTYAAKLGVKCIGTREEIIKRILELNKNDLNILCKLKPVSEVKAVEKVEEAAVEKVEETSQEDTKEEPSTFKKFGRNKKIKDEYTKMAEDFVSNLSIDEVLSFLKDNGISANKRNVVEVLAQALRDELLDIEEDAEDNAINNEDISSFDGNSYFEEFDFLGYNDPNFLTDKRSDAIFNKVTDILENYKNGNLTVPYMLEFLKNGMNEEEYAFIDDSNVSDVIILKAYIEFIKRFIDDEGNFVDKEEPYEISEVPFCCGHELTFLENENIYVCDCCSNEYEG